MSKGLLPQQFGDLESFVSAWALVTERERNKKRLSSTMGEIQAFYNVILPRMEEILSYLNQFPLNQMPEDAQRLLYLALSLAEISPAVERYKQPSVPDGFDPARYVPIHEHLF